MEHGLTLHQPFKQPVFVELESRFVGLLNRKESSAFQWNRLEAVKHLSFQEPAFSNCNLDDARTRNYNLLISAQRFDAVARH